MEEYLREYIEEGRFVRYQLHKFVQSLINLGEHVTNAFLNNNKILLCGNGGSAADCQHIAAEYVNKFSKKRLFSLPAIALTVDTSIITAVGNDISFDEVFSKQIESLGYINDILFCFSTSGTSPNIIKAAKQAINNKMLIVSFLGENETELNMLSDWTFNIPSKLTPIIQEQHITLNHMLCYIVDELIGDK